MKMMASLPLFSLFFLTLFFCSSSSTLTTQSSTKLIHQICSQSKYHDQCVSSMESHPNSSTANLINSAKTVIESALSNASDTYSFINQLTSNESIDDVLKMCLNDCKVVYDIGINKLGQSLTFLDLKEYIEVNTLLGAAEDQGKECDRIFVKPPVPESPSPLTHRNEVYVQLCNIAMDIVKLLV